jgi:hypothetical protein
MRIVFSLRKPHVVKIILTTWGIGFQGKIQLFGNAESGFFLEHVYKLPQVVNMGEAIF